MRPRTVVLALTGVLQIEEWHAQGKATGKWRLSARACRAA